MTNPCPARSGRRGRSGTPRSRRLTSPHPADILVGRPGNRSGPVRRDPPLVRGEASAPTRPAGVPALAALLDNGTEEGQSECGRPRLGPRVGVRALSQINSAPKRTTKKCLVRPVPVGWRQRRPALHDRTAPVPTRDTDGDDLDGEFDPGSGRTLAACLIHASRAGLPPVATLVVAERRTGE